MTRCSSGLWIVSSTMRTANQCRFRKLDSCVSMVQPAKDRMCNNISEAFDRARVGSILRERDVSPHVIIIGGIFCKNSSKVLCVEHDQMISALASDRPDQAFYISVLPGRAERDRPVPDAHRSHASRRPKPRRPGRLVADPDRQLRDALVPLRATHSTRPTIRYHLPPRQHATWLTFPRTSFPI